MFYVFFVCGVVLRMCCCLFDSVA